MEPLGISEELQSNINIKSNTYKIHIKIEEVTLFNKVHTYEIQKPCNIELLLLHIEGTQLRWFGHVSRISQKRLSKQALLATANGIRPVGRPRT